MRPAAWPADGPVARGGGDIVACILILGLAVRAIFLGAGFPQVADLAIFRQWARTIADLGLPAAYTGTNVNYPPASLYLFAAAGWVEIHLGAVLPPGSGDALLNSSIKLPSIAADVLTAWLIAAALHRQPIGRRALAVALYLFNPAVWYLSAEWGQIDSIYVLFLVASVLALERRSVPAAWLAFALAVCTKLQSLALLPLLLAVTWWRHGWPGLLKGAVVGVAAVAALSAPWLLTGQVASLLSAVWPHAAPRVTAGAYNLWYLLLLGRVHNVSSLLQPVALPFTFRQIGIGLCCLSTAYMLGAAWRQRARSLALPAALLALGMFTLLTEVHERFLLPTLPLLLLAAAGGQSSAEVPPPAGSRPSLWWAYAVLSATFLFNLVTIAPVTPALGGNLVARQDYSGGGSILLALSILAALANVVTLVWLLIRAWPSKSRA